MEDKWEAIVNRVKNGILAEEPEAALAGGLELLAEFGRTLEMISADSDRIATAIEKALADTISAEPAPVAHDL